MGLTEELERDASQFFREIEKMSDEDKKTLLIKLLDKYAHISSSKLVLDKNDFVAIKSMASKLYMDRGWPKFFKQGFSREISGQDSVNISLIESTIIYLNSKDCLKRLPEFDYEKGESK